MRRTFGLIALLAALASGQACLAQQQGHQQLQQQQDRQQRDLEEQRQQPQDDNPRREEYRTMASEARRHAEQATEPASKAKWLKMAAAWDGLGR